MDSPVFAWQDGGRAKAVAVVVGVGGVDNDDDKGEGEMVGRVQRVASMGLDSQEDNIATSVPHPWSRDILARSLKFRISRTFPGCIIYGVRPKMGIWDRVLLQSSL